MEPPARTHGGVGRVLSDIQQKHIMRACANRCECCKREYPRYILEVHAIGESSRINERQVVVMCAQCWHSTKNLPGHSALLRSIIAERPPEIRAKIQRILVKKSAPYMPETEFDLAEVFAEAYDNNGMDLFLNGM